MRLQISFELLLYLSVAGIALLFGLMMLASRWSGINNSVNSLGIYYFINSLNEELASGAMSFSLFVPRGTCNSTVSGHAIVNRYGTYYLTGNIKVPAGIFCPDGQPANFTVSYGTGAWVISR